jgi:hypothetical protein
MRRSRIDQIEHDGMVRLVAEHFQGEGYRVAATIPGFVPPPPINGLIPDVLACKEDDTVITEVETSASYHSPQAFQEFRAFSSLSSTHGFIFHAAIPRHDLEAARQLAALWNASPAKWWSI